MVGDSIHIGWDLSGNGTEYAVDYSNNAASGFHRSGITKDNNYRITGLDCNTSYYIRVSTITNNKSTYTSPVIEASTTDRASSWAENDVNLAKEKNLLTQKVQKDYKKNITREEFCELMVRLYEELGNTKATYV